MSLLPLFDAHLDLAWNALSFDRDIRLDLEETRAREEHLRDQPSRGRATVTIPELKASGAVVVVATLLARSGPGRRLAEARRTDLDYSEPSIAAAVARGQLAYYEFLEKQGHVRIIRSSADLDSHWSSWSPESAERTPLGVILSMEGTDPIVDCDHAQDWWDLGLRAAGLAHYGHGQHASGTGVDGRLTQAGLALLRKFEELGMVLDVTHLCDTSLDEALENFDGIVVASHHNCRALVPGDRQLSDEHLRRLIARGAVIGLSLDAWMLRPGWVRGESSPEEVSLQDAVDHIDHICQIAGTVDHCGLGTDLDGGFGHEQTPHDLKRFRDLQNLQGLLSRRGYGGDDIEAVFSGNWRRLYRNALPKD